VDVWLFGHTQKQLKLDDLGHVHVSPVHEAVLASGSPLMFINPGEGLIAVAVGAAWRFDAETERDIGEPVQVWHDLTPGTLALRPLLEFEVSKSRGLGGLWLKQLEDRTRAVHAHNTAEHARVAATNERKRREAQERQRAWEARRAPQQERIREAFDQVERWSRSEALNEAKVYFGEYLRGRIDVIDNPTAPAGLLVRWQTVVYFDLVAGREKPFGTRDAYNTILRRKVKMGQPDAFTLISRYLYELEDHDYIRRAPGYAKYPSFRPTTSGAWW
jgi:hypothetical protein